jgi:vacuolar protein sorting-associated protein 13A/C
MRIKLFAPIEIQNLLPHDFKLRVFDKATGKDWTNFLRRGGLSPVHVVELNRLLLLSIAVQPDGEAGQATEEWGASEFAIINSPNTEFTRETSLAMRDRRGVTLNLNLHFFPIPDSGGAFRVSVYAPYIILNKTGLDLNVKSKANMNALRSPAVNLRGSKPGEKALPQMFSYANDERSNRAVLRVEGAQWSKPQSFEAIGSKAEAVLNSTNKDSQIHIGISVDEGEGKYKLTKVVTLAPRFVVKSTLPETLLVCQPEGGEAKEVTSNTLLPLRTWRTTGRQQLQLRFAGGNHNWTSPFNVGDLGSVHVKIQKAGQSQELLKVEVSQEKATLFIKISRETKSWPFTLRNESDQELIFFQANPTSEWEDDEDNDVPGYRPIRYRLPGRSIMRYAWDYPAAKRKELTLTCNSRERQVKLTEIGNMVSIFCRLVLQ